MRVRTRDSYRFAWLLRVVAELLLCLTMLVLVLSLHANYGWRSYAKVARQGFHRNMHLALHTTHALVRWCALVLLLQVFSWSVLFAPASYAWEDILFLLSAPLNAAALLVLYVMVNWLELSKKGNWKFLTRRVDGMLGDPREGATTSRVNAIAQRRQLHLFALLLTLLGFEVISFTQHLRHSTRSVEPSTRMAAHRVSSWPVVLTCLSCSHREGRCWIIY